jgi:alanine dehydrogenase
VVFETVGFPRMHKEEGERRDFLPSLFARLGKFNDLQLFIEEGYGKGMGLDKSDYIAANARIRFTGHDEVYKKDLVIVLRAPEDEEIQAMKEGAVLVSMLHYDTRPLRNKLLKQKGIICFSMDGITDDNGNRMLVNYRGTSRAGARVAFNELKRRMPDFYSRSRRPIHITIIGMGAVGLNAAKAFEEFSDREFFDDNRETPGVIINMFPRNITKDKSVLEQYFKETDILVDASKRVDPSEIIVPNSLISLLPEHAIILDLTADPYNDKVDPMQVKGIEGIPTGNLDKYVIETDDEIYSTLPCGIDTTHRRVVVSCNAWPGVEPEECMSVYEEQIFPFLEVLLQKGPSALDINSENLYERALVRASLDYYLKSNCSC